MGFLSNSLRALAPVAKAAPIEQPAQQPIGSIVPTWDAGRDVTAPFSYYRNAREGYMADEVVFGCIEFRATSAGEPPVVAYKVGSDEKIDSHPSVQLLNHPNPFMGRSRFWASVLMSMDIGGNAYIEKVRSASGKVVQLWPLRPDRVTILPDAKTFIGGYHYMVGAEGFTLSADDVIHFKTRHPLDDYYGLPPIAVGAERIDLDVKVRKFARAFFDNAGVPSGLINILRALSNSDREAIRQSFRGEFSGPNGWFNPLVLDGQTATYTPMGLPLGESGLAMDTVNQSNEARICLLYSVPPSLIPTIVGMNSSSYANRAADQEQFWANTMVPIFSDLDSALTAGLADEYPDIDRLAHDLSTIKALQDDQDKLHTRITNAYKSGLYTFQEARQKLGEPAEPEEPGMLLVPTLFTPTWSDDMLAAPEPETAPTPAALPADGAGQLPSPNGQMRPLPEPAMNGRAH